MDLDPDTVVDKVGHFDDLRHAIWNSVLLYWRPADIVGVEAKIPHVDLGGGRDVARVDLSNVMEHRVIAKLVNADVVGVVHLAEDGHGDQGHIERMAGHRAFGIGGHHRPALNVLSLKGHVDWRFNNVLLARLWR